MKAQFDVGTFAPKRPDSRQQPNLQKRCQQTDLQRSGAAMLLDQMHRRLEPVEAGPHCGQQFEALLGYFHSPAIASK